MTNMRMNLTALTGLFILASVLLFSGFLLQWYVTGRIDGLEYMLGLNGLTEYDKGMLQGSVDWWILNRLSLFDPISYFLITAGIITYFFSALSIWRKTIKEKILTQKSLTFEKKINSKDIAVSDESDEIVQLKGKIKSFEKKLAISKNQINNLKENMNYLIKIIKESQLEPNSG